MSLRFWHRASRRLEHGVVGSVFFDLDDPFFLLESFEYYIYWQRNKTMLVNDIHTGYFKAKKHEFIKSLGTVYILYAYTLQRRKVSHSRLGELQRNSPNIWKPSLRSHRFSCKTLRLLNCGNVSEHSPGAWSIYTIRLDDDACTNTEMKRKLNIAKGVKRGSEEECMHVYHRLGVCQL